MTEYKHIYLLRNKDTGKYIFTYRKHKATFSSRKRAEEAIKFIKTLKECLNIEIIEL